MPLDPPAQPLGGLIAAVPDTGPTSVKEILKAMPHAQTSYLPRYRLFCTVSEAGYQEDLS